MTLFILTPNFFILY